MFFYDETGLELFNRITRLPEYYLTRTELGLLRRHAGEISEWFGEDCTLLEYGSGNSEKVKILLDTLVRPRSYIALDISARGLLEFVESMAQQYPEVDVVGVCADFSDPEKYSLDFIPARRIIAFFPGSSIGNFEPAKAQDFLRGVARTVGTGGGMLVGVDLRKDPGLLRAAYNDAEGITAQFNLNLLRRFNREFGGNFRLEDFEHFATYDPDKGRIEMHLLSRKPTVAKLRGTEFSFRRGERIHTENSYKYGVEQFQAMAADAGWTPRKVWTDENNLFSLHYLEI
jgi:probable methyltransferase